MMLLRLVAQTPLPDQLVVLIILGLILICSFAFIACCICVCNIRLTLLLRDKESCSSRGCRSSCRCWTRRKYFSIQPRNTSSDVFHHAFELSHLLGQTKYLIVQKEAVRDVLEP